MNSIACLISPTIMVGIWLAIPAFAMPPEDGGNYDPGAGNGFGGKNKPIAPAPAAKSGLGNGAGVGPTLKPGVLGKVGGSGGDAEQWATEQGRPPSTTPGTAVFPTVMDNPTDPVTGDSLTWNDVAMRTMTAMLVGSGVVGVVSIPASVTTALATVLRSAASKVVTAGMSYRAAGGIAFAEAMRNPIFKEWIEGGDGILLTGTTADPSKIDLVKTAFQETLAPYMDAYVANMNSSVQSVNTSPLPPPTIGPNYSAPPVSTPTPTPAPLLPPTIGPYQPSSSTDTAPSTGDATGSGGTSQ